MSERPQNKHLKPFQKGQSGNPNGRPKIPEDLVKHKELTSEELKRRIAKYFRMTHEGITAALENPETIALDLIIASTISTAIRNGDIAKSEVLFVRALGKVRDTVEVKQPEPMIIERSDGSKIELGTKIDENVIN